MWETVLIISMVVLATILFVTQEHLWKAVDKLKFSTGMVFLLLAGLLIFFEQDETIDPYKLLLGAAHVFFGLRSVSKSDSSQGSVFCLFDRHLSCVMFMPPHKSAFQLWRAGALVKSLLTFELACNRPLLCNHCGLELWCLKSYSSIWSDFC